MSGKLTKAQRAFLIELAECGQLCILPPATRAMAFRLRARGLCSHQPETVTLHECWQPTKAGRAAVA